MISSVKSFLLMILVVRLCLDKQNRTNGIYLLTLEKLWVAMANGQIELLRMTLVKTKEIILNGVYES
jgi:hypothetical protein